MPEVTHVHGPPAVILSRVLPAVLLCDPIRAPWSPSLTAQLSPAGPEPWPRLKFFLVGLLVALVPAPLLDEVVGDQPAPKNEQGDEEHSEPVFPDVPDERILEAGAPPQ